MWKTKLTKKYRIKKETYPRANGKGESFIYMAQETTKKFGWFGLCKPYRWKPIVYKSACHQDEQIAWFETKQQAKNFLSNYKDNNI